MSLLKSFFVSLGLNVDAEAFARGQLAVSILEKGIGALVGKIQELASAIPNLVDHLTDQASELEKASAKTGATTDALQELAYAANQTADLGLSELSFGLQQLSRHMAEAQKGSGGAAEAFGKLKVQVADGGKLRATDDVLMDIADAMSHMDNAAERTALSMHLFGRSGVQLIPFLKEGREGIEKWRQEAQGLGLVMSRELIEQASANEEAQKRLKGAWEGIKNTVGGPFLELAAQRANRMAQWIMQNRELIKQLTNKAWETFKAVTSALSRIVNMLADGITALVKAIVSLGPALGIAVAAFVAMTTAVLLFGTASVGAALRSAAAWALASLPIIGLLAALALVFLVAEDIWTSMKGGEGIVLDLAEKWVKFLEDWTKPDPDDWWITTKIKDALKWLLHLHEKFDDFASVFKGSSYGGLADNYRGINDEQLRKMGIDPANLPKNRPSIISRDYLDDVAKDYSTQGKQLYYTAPQPQRGVSGVDVDAAQDREGDTLARRTPTVTVNGGITVTANGVQDPKAMTMHFKEVVADALADAIKQTQVETSQ